MARLSHLWTLFSLLCFVETSLWAHFIREKGTAAGFSCGFKAFDQTITWQVRAGHDFINVTSCTSHQKICVDHLPQQFHGEVENEEDDFTSILTIKNVRINETEFRCVNKYDVATVTLEVYARPSKPLCDPVELDYTKKNLQFRCRVTHVFPSVSAMLYIKGVFFSKKDTISSHCSNDESGRLTLDGLSAECVWRMSAAKLEPVKYKYYVNMFPNLSNSTGINVPNAVSQYYTLQLSSPVAVIDIKSCPIGFGVVDGKILTGSTASCRCVLESPGFPTGQARWYTLHGNQSLGIDNIVDGSSTLEIYNSTPVDKAYQRDIATTIATTKTASIRTSQSYRCRAESSLKNSLNWGPVYTPVFTSQSYRCRAESLLKNLLNWGPVYTPVFTTPSSGPETYSLRIEIVAGILAGFVVLTVVIAVVIWKWRGRKRQNYETTRVIYNIPIVDAQSDSGKPECSGNYYTLSF